MRHALHAVILIGLVAGRASAQSSAIAEQLFNEGRDLAKAGKWAEACPKFEASLAKDPALGTRLNLATCYERVGKLASAWGLYRESAELAGKAGDAKRADYAQKQAAVLEPRVPKLTITAPAKPPVGLTVQRDGAPVSTAELGSALYVDPGPHEVTASAPGFETFTGKVTLVEGKPETLAIPALVAKPVAPVPPVVEQPEEPVDDGPAPRPIRKYVGLGVAGAGVVVVGVGLVFGAQAMAKNTKAKDLCGDDLVCSPAQAAEGRKLVSDGRSRATLSTVFVIGGAAAMAAGAVIFFTAPRAAESSRTARVVPVIDRDGLGIGLSGRF